MVEAENLQKQISGAAGWLDAAEAILSGSPEEFLSDPESRDLASFYLFLAIQRCVDLATHWIARASWEPPPRNPKSAFDVLAGQQAIDRELTAGLEWAVSLWQQIEREYWTIDHARIQSESRQGISSLRHFLAAAATEAGRVPARQD